MNKINQISKIKLIQKYLKIYFWYLLITSILRLSIEYYVITNEYYPYQTNIFNSNKYIGIDLIIKMFLTIIIAPIFEEFVYRFWLFKYSNNKLNYIKFVVFLVFLFQFLLAIFAFFMFKPLYEFKIYLKTIPHLYFLSREMLTYIQFYFIPITLSIIILYILKLFKILKIFRLKIEFIIENNFKLFFYLSALLFSFNHLEVNVNTELRLITVLLIIPSCILILLAILKTKFMEIYGIRSTILLHSFNNLFLLFTDTIFWRNKLAWNYRIGLGIIIITIFIIIIKNIKTKNVELLDNVII